LRPSYQIEFLRSAAKELAALPKAIQQRIARVIDSLSDDPRPPGAKALQGDGKYLRIRVGDYRVIYQVADDRLIVLVVKVGHRRDVYQR